MRSPGTTEAIRPEKEEEGPSELAKIVIGCSVGACGLLLILIIVVIVKKFRPKDRKTEYMMYQEKVSKPDFVYTMYLYRKFPVSQYAMSSGKHVHGIYTPLYPNII